LLLRDNFPFYTWAPPQDGLPGLTPLTFQVMSLREDFLKLAARAVCEDRPGGAGQSPASAEPCASDGRRGVKRKKPPLVAGFGLMDGLC
jgi:hypothetical protein